MKKLIAISALLATGLYSSVATGSVVAIIDSGTDMLHKDIEPQAWINHAEVPRNDRDEDGNGYQDDIHGWNFAEGNSQVIDYKYLGTLTQDVRRFFEIQTGLFLGTATEDDIAWMRSKIEEADFVKQLQIYGNFMHGTHVGGIAIKNSVDAKLLAVKLIPTEVSLPFNVKPSGDKGLGMFLLKQALGALAKQQATLMGEIGAYVHSHKADIANGSFGTGYPQAKMIVETLIKTFVKNPKPEDIEEGTLHFLNETIKHAASLVTNAPNTLFVFAAGNDGLNNDEYPTSPTNIKEPNAISVAATLGNNSLASFSNYGPTMVDVAAPGVGIEATVPGNQYLKVSGTSQAAPFVANIASKVKDANPSLSPAQVKKVITGTVDRRSWLKGKVKFGGVVNRARAVRAAELSIKLGLENAIKSSHKEVKDLGETKNLGPINTDLKGFVLPLPSQFVVR